VKKIGSWLGLILASVSPLSAQVSVEVKLEQDQFLPSEALRAAVRVTNRSGQTLRLGAEPDWLTFSVESRDSFVVGKEADVPVTGEFVLESSKTATKRVDLAPYFTLDRQGRYALSATVRIKQWDHQITSAPTSFTIIEGAKLWEQAFGVPKTIGATNEPPEVRKYILQQVNYLKGRIRLYLRLTDESGSKSIRVFPIGSLVSFSRPEPQLDKSSNLHVLYASGPQSYIYTVFNPDGDTLIHQTYEYVDSRPRLQPHDDGNISVKGGVRRVMADDLPAPKAELSHDAPDTTEP
jgi:hypothetical protein